ncbi:MAG TPA: rRNA maturation RNase YbeY [Candidatus Limnocylindria bacterium]|nr:rRNA maturation RNase YbeY [Candidatus Limnocylindria bacterium]
MGCTVTFHDRIGRERLASAVEPMAADDALALIDSALAETVRITFGARPCEIELSFVADPEMTRLNFDHMGEREPTDVLSFPLHDWQLDEGRSHLAEDDGVSPPGPLLLGDVVIDVDQAVRQAAPGGWSVTEEIILLAIHGTLHLLGHDHADIDEEQAMRGVEHQVLAMLHRKHREVDWKPGSLFDRAGHAVSSGT